MLAFEEWLKLSNEERGERYKDLSNEDKYRTRVCDYHFYREDHKSDETLEIPDFLKDMERIEGDDKKSFRSK